MNITRIHFGRLSVPLITPFKTALRQVSHCEDLVVIVETDSGHIGLGAAPSTPQITGDTHASIEAAIRDVIGPKIIGHPLADFNTLTHTVASSMVHNSSAKAAVDMALYDLWGQLHNAPVYALLGGHNAPLKSDITISLNTVEEMVQDCEAALKRGFTELKIKVGGDEQEDILRVLAIADAVGGRATLCLDVNQAWSAKTSVRILNKLHAEGVALELVEQPVHYADIDGMTAVCRYSPYPVMADESAFNAAQLLQLHQHRAADIANIKLMKTGGISGAVAMAHLARQLKVPCMIGCMLEGPVGITAAAHLAAAFRDVIRWVDLDGAFLCKPLPDEQQQSLGIQLQAPMIHLNDRPGLGHQNLVQWLK